MSKKRYCYLVIALQAGLMIGAISNMTKIGAAGGGAMVVTGNETGANQVIAWDNFNIGKNAAVNFKGDSTNLLDDAAGNIQEAFSQLNGEGKNTDMVNPHGIIFGEDAQINVGSIYASTRNVNKIYLEAFESSSVLVGKITASKLGQADWPGGNQGWLAVKQQQGGGHFLGTSGKSGSIASP